MMRLNDMAQNYGANNIDSLERHICTASVVYHFCSENRSFKILPEKTRSDCESQKSGFGFGPKNPPRV